MKTITKKIIAFFAVLMFVVPIYSANQWYVTGDAVQGGTAELIQDATNNTKFLYIGQLSNKSFKISDGTNHYVPLCGDNDPLGQTIDLRKEINASEKGFRLRYVAENEFFKISVTDNGSTQKFLVEKAEAPKHVYLIGGPVNTHDPNWILDDGVELQQDTDNPFLFRYKGMLRYNTFGDERGSIKFIVGKSWSGGYHPEGTASVALLNSLNTPSKMRIDGADTKWTIPADGTGNGYYEILLNTLNNTLLVETFRKVEEVYPDKIYIAGAAMPNGWNNQSPEVMTQVNGQDGIYSWTGDAFEGEFKFLKVKGSWNDCYVATSASEKVIFASPHNIVHEVNYSSGGGKDYKFIMPEGSKCTILVNLNTMTMTVTKEKELEALDLWIVGSAIPNGKQKLVSENINSATNYRYHGALLSGTFKIITTENVDQNTEYYVPVAVTDAISDDALIFKTTDTGEVGWTVSTPNDLYKLKFKMASNKYQGFIHDVENLYIIGGATSAGWDVASSIEMAKDASNPGVFTFNGALNIAKSGTGRDQIKFLMERSSSSLSYHPATQNEPVIGSKFITENKSDDYRWVIKENQQGNYIIIVNTLEETIDAKYAPSSNESIQQNDNVVVATSAGKIHVTSNSELEQNVFVFDPTGKKITQKPFKGYIEINLSAGVYIVKITTNNIETLTTKVCIIK